MPHMGWIFPSSFAMVASECGVSLSTIFCMVFLSTNGVSTLMAKNLSHAKLSNTLTNPVVGAKISFVFISSMKFALKVNFVLSLQVAKVAEWERTKLFFLLMVLIHLQSSNKHD